MIASLWCGQHTDRSTFSGGTTSPGMALCTLCTAVPLSRRVRTTISARPAGKRPSRVSNEVLVPSPV